MLGPGQTCRQVGEQCSVTPARPSTHSSAGLVVRTVRGRIRPRRCQEMEPSHRRRLRAAALVPPQVPLPLSPSV